MLLNFGRQTTTLEIADDQRVSLHRGPAALADTGAAVAAALDAPFHFPPLRQAVTPDDHVTVIIDDGLSDLTPILHAIREHLGSAGVAPDAITILRPAEHDPNDPAQLAYLATTKGGRRIYLNRALVEAEALVVVSARRFDAPGAQAAVFPAFSDADTRGQAIDPEEAREVGWLLGLPFHVQLIDAAGGGYADVVAGVAEAAREAEKRRDAAWRVRVTRRPDTVLVTSSADGVVAALDNAARVVQPNGRIVVLIDGVPALPASFDAIRQASEAEDVRSDDPAVRAWAQAAGHARISLLSGLDAAAAEELFASALAGPEQVQRFVARSADCLILEDGHRSLAVLE